ncbi:MAG TPA: hypothetical protein VFT59_00470, partial [Candidatus Saccharimonadales bacterium]|nr:hypothetical protein [Candidatus Saccharimonadales bacterium]
MQGHLLIFGDVLPTPLYEIKMSFSSGFPEEAFEIRTERIDSIATTVAFSNLLKGMLEETSVADTVA